MNNNQKKIIELAKKKDISKMSFREIGRELNISNPQTVIYHLEQLKKKGVLYFDVKKRQKVAKPETFVVDKFFNIPVVGSANCGPALELAQEDIQGYLKISTKLLGRKKPDGLFVVKAVGESMNAAKDLAGGPIDDGDYVIVDRNNINPLNGAYVLSIIDGAANIKKFYRNGEELRLVSESTLDIPPIVFHKSEINTLGYLVNGVVLRVVKN